MILTLVQLLFLPSAFSAEDVTDRTISVTEAAICEGIMEREPLAAGDLFPADISRLYCFTQIKSEMETQITHAWYKGDAPVAEVPLKVGISSGWRTFSSKNILTSQRGNWRVEILTEEGRLLKKIYFAIN